MYGKFTELISNNCLVGSRLCVAAADRDSVGAVAMAMERGLGCSVMTGDEKLLVPLLEEAGITDKVEVVHAGTPLDAAEKAVQIARSGRVNGLMKGLVNTQDFLRAVLNKEYGLRTGRLLSHMTIMEIPGENKLSFCTDAGFNVLPDLVQKKKILRNALEAAAALGYTHVNAACLAANERIDPLMPATADAAAIVEAWKAGEFNDLPCSCTVEGPMAMDVIACREAAEHKGIKSEISGNVDMVLVPNIECGNALCKTLVHYALAEVAGFVVGASVPIILLSRGESPENKFIAMALSCIISEGMGGNV
ncbi:phosphate butyryltransferase [Synergistaceae bacterium OttesenSCG-928-D05]|nr:phosphate butyryltransferase [Synergistaceae bacterium OttesenSCG-928-D05]